MLKYYVTWLLCTYIGKSRPVEQKKTVVGPHDEYSIAPGGSRPLVQANQLEPQAGLYRQPVNHIHHRPLLLLLSPKADTHFTVPRRVEG